MWSVWREGIINDRVHVQIVQENQMVMLKKMDVECVEETTVHVQIVQENQMVMLKKMDVECVEETTARV